MIINVNKFHIKPNPSNEVTSEKVFKPRRSKDKDGNWRFHEEGIFSPKIFGKLYKCSCGENREIGTWCESCGDRVVSKDKMPDFYINSGVLAPFAHTDFSEFGKKATGVKSLLGFKAFLYDNEVVDFDLEKLDIREYSDQDRMLIGVEAARAYCPELTDEWISENCSINIPIPHPIYRPIIQTSSSYVLGSMNEILIELLDRRARIQSFKVDEVIDKFQEITLSSLLYEKYLEIVDKIFEVLISGKKSVLNQEVLAQPLTGAFRAVITNNDDLDEDTVLIGSELVSTIFPDIHKKYDGDIDMINEHIQKNELLVLVNRPPTIGEKSMIAMKPLINKDQTARFIISTNSIIFDGMAADTDGDVFLSVALYSKEANKEAIDMLPSNNYIGGSDGRVRNKMPEDFVYAMSEIYRKESPVKTEIKDIILSGLPLKYKQEASVHMNMASGIQDSGYEHDLELMELIPRASYMQIYKLISKNMWEYCQVPTVGDIVDLISGDTNDTVDSITEFLGNKDKLESLLNKDSIIYSNEESEEFIKKVISSNVTDISDAGWFYKKLMASTDDIRIVKEDCGSEGLVMAVDNITKDLYQFSISGSYVEELGDFAEIIYEEFMEKLGDLDVVHVRTPIRCLEAKDRRLCEKCAGTVRKSHDKTYIPENFGVFSTLMITEHATQASLDSMNKGLSENVNNLLEKKFPSRKMTWEDVVREIDTIVGVIGNVGVQSRFYEVALMSRIFRKDEDSFSQSSFQHSITHQDDPLGAYIFSPTSRNLQKLVNHGEFDAKSIKTKVMFDVYD